MNRSSFQILLVTTIAVAAISSSAPALSFSNREIYNLSAVKNVEVARQVQGTLHSDFDFTSTSSTIWERNVNSTHFKIFYNLTGPNAATDDYVISIRNSLENSWTVEINSYGFSAPPSSLITVYIMDILKTRSEYGETSGNLFQVANITLDKSMGVDTPLLQYVCAHEFFHAIQLSYGLLAKWYGKHTTDWVIEGTAVWMGARVYPQYTGSGALDVSYVYWANYYLNKPYRTLTQLSYDAVLFWIFIDEHHGGITTIKDIMQQNESMNSIQAVNQTLNTLRGTTFTKVFKEWTIANCLKDFYYLNGHLFRTVYNLTLQYSGDLLPADHYVSDWGAYYIVVNSSVIYMPILFEGEQSHNLTKILVEHSLPLVSDFLLNSTYSGFFPVMQADNLDRIIIIVRSLGNETSNNQVTYILRFLASSYTPDGPKELISSMTVLTIAKTTGSDASQTLQLTTVDAESSQVSATSMIATVSGSSSQVSSPRTTTVVSRSSSQNSSETGPVNVRMEGDVNGDGIVNTIDLEAFSRAYGSRLGSPNWNPNCDFNSDNIINVLDLQKLAKNFGKSV